LDTGNNGNRAGTFQELAEALALKPLGHEEIYGGLKGVLTPSGLDGL